MKEPIHSVLEQPVTFFFDKREVNATVRFVLREGRADAIVTIIDKQLNHEFWNDEILFRWHDHQVLIKPDTTHVRLQQMIDAIAEMLRSEYPGNIKGIL